MITTLNLSVFLLDYVSTRIEQIDISVEEFIALCLKRKIAAMCRCRYDFFRKAVVYQPEGGGYVKVKVGFSWDEYDSNLLCRFIWKASVSFLAAMAVHDYFEEVLRELNGEAPSKDNCNGFLVFIDKIMLSKTDKMYKLIEKYQVTLKTHPPKR